MGMQKIIKDIINVIKNADNNMELDGLKYRTPREYTIALIETYAKNNT